jgi:hypothetical protein
VQEDPKKTPTKMWNPQSIPGDRRRKINEDAKIEGGSRSTATFLASFKSWFSSKIKRTLNKLK